MIIYPAACSDVKATLVDADQASRAESIIIQNRTGSHTVALKWDGGTGDLDYANGIHLKGGEERVITAPAGKGSFHNQIEAVCDTGQEVDLVVHIIE